MRTIVKWALKRASSSLKNIFASLQQQQQQQYQPPTLKYYFKPIPRISLVVVAFVHFFSSSLQTYIFFSLYSALDLLNNICTFSGTLHVYLIHLFVSFVCVFDVTWQTSKQFANVSLRVLRYRTLNTSTYRDFLRRRLPLRYYFSFCNTKKRQTKPNARFMWGNFIANSYMIQRQFNVSTVSHLDELKTLTCDKLSFAYLHSFAIQFHIPIKFVSTWIA